jgi:hypothetical protein
MAAPAATEGLGRGRRCARRVRVALRHDQVPEAFSQRIRWGKAGLGTAEASVRRSPGFLADRLGLGLIIGAFAAGSCHWAQFVSH